MSPPDAMRVLYITGYSRSGSTIMDMVLNAHPHVASAGELTFLQEDAIESGRLCGCGAAYKECEIYGPWLRNRASDEHAMQRRVEHRSGFGKLLQGRVSASDKSAYRDYAHSLFTHLAESQNARVIVDSSKSARDAAGRALALSQVAGLDVRVLHLTRDPQAVLQSYLNVGSNWVLEGRRKPRPLDSWRPIIGWALANRLASRTGAALGPDRYMHARFEDFLADPAAFLERLGALIELDLSPCAEQILAKRPFTAGHLVGGNRTRLKPQVIALGQPKTKPVPQPHALALQAICGRTMREMGYG